MNMILIVYIISILMLLSSPWFFLFDQTSWGVATLIGGVVLFWIAYSFDEPELYV